MITRIYIKQSKYDSRGPIIDSYLVDAKLGRKSLERLGQLVILLAVLELAAFFVRPE